MLMLMMAISKTTTTTTHYAPVQMRYMTCPASNMAPRLRHMYLGGFQSPNRVCEMPEQGICWALLSPRHVNDPLPSRHALEISLVNCVDGSSVV